MLKEHPKLAQCEFYSGTTNPMCRATFLGHRNIVSLLIKYGSDINKKSHDLRTPLCWAAWRNNIEMIDLIMQSSPDVQCVDKDGWNALDLAIIRINYKAAKRLSNIGLTRRPKEDYYDI